MALSAEEVRAFVVEKRKAIDRGGLTHYELLDVPEDASSELIQRAYFQAAKSIHPDRLDHLGLSDLKRDAGEVFQSLSKAYEVLSDVQSRALYLRELAQKRQGIGTEMPPEEEARIFAHRAGHMLKRRNFSDAVNFLEQALERTPDNRDYQLDLAYALLHIGGEERTARAEQAKKLLDAILKKEPGNGKALYYVSLYYKAKGDRVRQRRFLSQAVQIDPDLTEAQREKRLLDMRTKRSGAVGFMGKLKGMFGKSDEQKKKARRRRRGKA